MAIKIIHTKNLKWVDIVNPDENDILYLKDNFKFHPLDFEDVLTPAMRSKIDDYDSYTFLILLFPQISKENKEIKPAEVDFFVGKGFFVTIHDGSMKTLVNLVKNVAFYDNVRSQYMASSSGFLLYSILDLLFKRSIPILDNLNRDILNAGREAFEFDNQTPHKLSHLKKNIIVYRRIMKMHKFILSKLGKTKKDYMMFKDYKPYFLNLVEIAENIWDMLASDKESVESYEGTNQSLTSHRINDILQVLTVVSVIVTALTLTTDIFVFFERDHIIKYLGLTSEMHLVLLFTTVLSIIALVLILLFKKKKWM